MKHHVILTGTVLVALLAAWTAFGQPESEGPSSDRGLGRGTPPVFLLLSPEEAAELREKWPNMSEEEREKFRVQMQEKLENLSAEERDKLMSQMRTRRRTSLGREEQLKAIAAIEAELAKLKATVDTVQPEGGRSFRDLSEQERTELMEQRAKAREDRQKALQAIMAQVARLQGQGQPAAEGAEYLIVNTAQLEPIQASAAKEKAKETAQLLERLIARARGRRVPGGGRPPVSRPRPRRGQQEETQE